MKGDKLTVDDISRMIDNDEGLYRWFKSVGSGKRKFIRDNRAELEKCINQVRNGEKRQHFLRYG